MMALPLVWGLIALTAVLSAVVSQALPVLPKYWNAFIDIIKRKFTKEDEMDVVDVIIIAQLQERIDELEEQINNMAERLSNREHNRKYNIRRDVREYLKELQND